MAGRGRICNYCCTSHQHFGTKRRIWSQSRASVHIKQATTKPQHGESLFFLCPVGQQNRLRRSLAQKHRRNTFCSQLQKFKSPNKTRKVSLMLTDRQPKKQEVAIIVAKLCQRDGLNGFLPLVNLFCNVLTFPQTPPSSVLLTMPGSSRDLHLPLCFLNPCFLWCFLFHAQLIRPPSKQIRAQGHTQLTTP